MGKGFAVDRYEPSKASWKFTGFHRDNLGDITRCATAGLDVFI